MTNRNYLLLIAAGLFMIIFSMIIIKMIFDTKVQMAPAYETHINKTFIQFNNLKGQKRKFPDVQFYDPKGRLVSISDFKGQYVLLNLWATWCPGCVKELPSLGNLRRYMMKKESPLTVIAVSLDRERNINEIAEFLVQYNVGPFALYHDRNKEIMKAYPVKGMPTTVLLDPEGHILYEFLGEADWSNYFLMRFLREEIRALKDVLERHDSP